MDPMYSKTLSLRFPPKVINEPVVVNLVKHYDLSFNILKATIYPRKEGLMVMELRIEKINVLHYLKFSMIILTGMVALMK